MNWLTLPNLTGQAGIGAAQRRQAAIYGIHLISKRDFARVLSTPGATIDGIHLSAQGAAAMAELAERTIGPLLEAGRNR